MIPKGSRLKEYLPKGVINVVSSDDSLDNIICQKPKLAKVLAFPSWYVLH